MNAPRTASEAAIQTRIADRAASITADYHCTILADTVMVTRNDDPSRSYDVRDGVCTCPAFKNYGTCKHSLGIVALVEAEVARLTQLCTVLDTDNIRRAIDNGRDIAEAARCEMSLDLYRACTSAEAVAA